MSNIIQHELNMKLEGWDQIKSTRLDTINKRVKFVSTRN